MADPTNDDQTKAADAAPVEQDRLFKLQMAVSDFVLGNARYLGSVVGVILLVALVYGVVTSWTASREAEEFSEIARIDYKMPKVEQLALFGLAPMDDKTDTARMGNVEEGARRYTALGDESHGAAAVYAYLKAADAWRRVGKADQRLAALEKASKKGVKGLAGFSADTAYAAALVDAGRTDDALALYRDMAGRHQNFFAERSLLSLAEAQIAADKKDDAKRTLDELRTRFPQTPRENEVTFLEGKISGSGG